jgi:hypothetical protein
LQSDALKQDDIWSTSILQITQAIAFILQLDLALIQLEEGNGQDKQYKGISIYFVTLIYFQQLFCFQIGYLCSSAKRILC